MKRHLTTAIAHAKCKKKEEKQTIALMLKRLAFLENENATLRPKVKSASAVIQYNALHKQKISKLEDELEKTRKLCGEFYRQNKNAYDRYSIILDCIETLNLPARQQFFVELGKRESTCELHYVESDLFRMLPRIAS